MQTVVVVKVKRVRDAVGAKCRDCDAVFDVTNSWPWGWRKSQWLHESSGHKMDMYGFKEPA